MSKLAKKKRAPFKVMKNKPLQPVKDQDSDSEAIERAVYDGMQDLRVKKPR